jgi:DNA-binding CsgD family transcriptional regulator
LENRTVGVQFPSPEEMAKTALRLRTVTPVWTPQEQQALNDARQALRAVPMSGSLGSVFEALRPCVPFACGLLDTIKAARPFEPVDTLYRVPEAFISSVAHLVETDPSPLVALRLPIGLMCNPASWVSGALEWRKWPLVDALYPHHGIDFPSVLILSSTPRAYDRELTTLWFFNEHNQRPVSDRERQKVEALHQDILAAIERLRLPILPHDSIRDQMLREQNAGYALFRLNGDLIEHNRQAVMIARQYTTNHGDHVRAPLSALLRWAQSTPSPSGFSAQYTMNADKTAMLEANLHFITQENHAIAEDAILLVLRTIPIQPTPVQPAKQTILESLPPKQRQIATILVNSGLSFKEIASELQRGEGTVRKHAELVYRALGVRSRAELAVLLK